MREKYEVKTGCTPSPWFVNVWTTGRRTVEHENGLVICEVHNTHEGNEANANMLSASPDLFEALKIVSEQLWCYVYKDQRQSEYRANDGLIKARAALAKAKGE
jgi:hypothetical protein